MYGFQLVRILDRAIELGLTDSYRSFSLEWCGKDDGYMYDYFRRDGMNRRVRATIVAKIRNRLSEIAAVAPTDLATEVRAIDADIVRDVRLAALLGRAQGIGSYDSINGADSWPSYPRI